MNQNDVVTGHSRAHLTAKEISRWLVEGPEQTAAQHVQDCWACQAKLAEAQAPLAAFRSAVIDWSESRNASRLSVVSRREASQIAHWTLRLWMPIGSLALATLLAVGFAKGPELFHHASGQQTALVSSTSAASDAALMDQVDTEVSEAVPDAMAPLTDLVAWDSNEGSSAGTTIPEKNSPGKPATQGAITKPQVDLED